MAGTGRAINRHSSARKLSAANAALRWTSRGTWHKRMCARAVQSCAVVKHTVITGNKPEIVAPPHRVRERPSQRLVEAEQLPLLQQRRRGRWRCHAAPRQKAAVENWLRITTSAAPTSRLCTRRGLISPRNTALRDPGASLPFPPSDLHPRCLRPPCGVRSAKSCARPHTRLQASRGLVAQLVRPCDARIRREDPAGARRRLGVRRCLST